MKKHLMTFVPLLILALFSAHLAAAQTTLTPLECGAIVEAELVSNDDNHAYSINLRPGDNLTIHLQRIGSSLELEFSLYDPTDNRIRSEIYITNESNSETVSATGTYELWVGASSYSGAYVLGIGCVLRDGTVISPGDAPQQPAETAAPVTTSGSAVVSQFSGVGFPGLAPVDFSNVARFPLILGTPMTGAVTPSGGEILGFQLDGTAGSTANLSFTRLAGNLNLGLVVLSAENQVMFQASLVTSQTLSTQFTLPADGQYTIGVFRIDLMPPPSPESTAFTLRVEMS